MNGKISSKSIGKIRKKYWNQSQSLKENKMNMVLKIQKKNLHITFNRLV